MLHLPNSQPRLGFHLGCCLLAVATLGSLLLTLSHFDVVELPGCGLESACAAAAASRWGTLPLVGWPTSFLGLAYFEAMLAAWILSRGQLPRSLQNVVRIGGVISVLLLTVILFEGFLCVYCLTVHTANLLWIAGMEWSRRRRGSKIAIDTARRPLIAFASAFALAGLLLVVMDLQATAAGRDWLDGNLDDSIQHALSATNDRCRRNSASVTTADDSATVTSGRYVSGPTDAAHHVIVFSDYQCPSCRTIHDSLQRMLARRSDLSISARHFPFCTDCNEHIDQTRHANACRAAQAAEAAGLVRGSDAFWQMHDWLFARRGQFTDDELEAFATEIDLPLEEFHQAMNSEEVLDAIRQDTQAAHEAGLKFTPMMFLDGKEIDTGKEQKTSQHKPR